MSNDEYDLPEEYSKNPNEPKYERKRMKEEEPLVLRVLPLPANRIGDYWGLHFGYSGQDIKDPTKSVWRPFLCIEERDRNRMIVSECPACTYANPRIDESKRLGDERRKEIARLTAIAKEKNVAQDVLEKKISALYERDKPVTDWTKSHNCDRKFRIRTVDLKGNFVLLEVSYKTFKILKSKIEEANQSFYPNTDRKIVANGRKGLYFKFTRTGTGFAAVDSIDVYRDGQDQKVFHQATDEILAKADEAFGTFQEMQDSVRLTYAQISQLVELDKLGGGQADPVEVNKVWGAKLTPKQAPKQNTSTTEEDPFGDEEVRKEAPKPEPKAEAKPEPKEEVKAEPKQEPKIPVQATEDPFGDAAPAKAPAKEPAKATPLMSPEELDDLFA